MVIFKVSIHHTCRFKLWFWSVSRLKAQRNWMKLSLVGYCSRSSFCKIITICILPIRSKYDFARFSYRMRKCIEICKSDWNLKFCNFTYQMFLLFIIFSNNDHSETFILFSNFNRVKNLIRVSIKQNRVFFWDEFCSFLID